MGEKTALYVSQLTWIEHLASAAKKVKEER